MLNRAEDSDLSSFPGLCRLQDKPFSVQETWEEIVQATQKARCKS